MEKYKDQGQNPEGLQLGKKKEENKGSSWNYRSPAGNIRGASMKTQKSVYLFK